MLGLKLSITSILLLFVMLQSYSVKGSYFCCSCFWLVYSERDFEVCGGYDNIHTGKGSCKTGWYACDDQIFCRSKIRGPFHDDE